MAWVRCCGGTAKKSKILYENGSWNIGYDNPGGYTYTGITAHGATLNPSNFVLNGSSSSVGVIGTSVKVDLTNIDIVKINVKKQSGQTYGASLLIRSSKNLANGSDNIVIQGIPNISDYTEIVADVSALTGEYYICITTITDASVQVECNKIWLE